MVRTPEQILNNIEKIVSEFENKYLFELRLRKDNEIDIRIKIGSSILEDGSIFGDLEPTFEDCKRVSNKDRKKHDELVDRMDFFISVYEEFQKKLLRGKSLEQIPSRPGYPKRNYVGVEGPGIKVIHVADFTSNLDYATSD